MEPKGALVMCFKKLFLDPHTGGDFNVTHLKMILKDLKTLPSDRLD